MPEQFLKSEPDLQAVLQNYRSGRQAEGYLFQHLVKYANYYPVMEIWKQLNERERYGMINFLTLMSLEEHRRLIHWPAGPDLLSKETMDRWNEFVRGFSAGPHDSRDWMVAAANWVDPYYLWLEKLPEVQKEDFRKYVDGAEAYYQSEPQAPGVLGNLVAWGRWKDLFSDLDDPEIAKRYGN